MAETKNRFDPPDPHLIDLAVQINKKARQGKVMFCSKQGEVLAVFTNGSKRVALTLSGRPSEVDIEDLVQALKISGWIPVGGCSIFDRSATLA